MSNSFENAILKYKPIRIESKANEMKLVFVLSDNSRKSLAVTNNSQLKMFKEIIANMKQFDYEEQKDGIAQFFFNWKEKTNNVLKSEIEKEPLSVPVSIPVGDRSYLSTEGDVTLEEAKEELHYIMEKGKLLECVVTSSGTVIENNSVQIYQINPSVPSVIFQEMSKNEENSMGTVTDDITIGGTDYIFTKYKFGDEKIIKVTRKIDSFSSLVMGMSSEMKVRLNSLGSGIIVTTLHPYVKMEPVISMMRKVDNHFDRLTCEIGNCLIETKLPKKSTASNLESLRDSHFKYIIMDITDPQVGVNMEEVMKLVYSGKIVILGYNNDSSYSSMMSLLSELGGNEFESTKVLMSTIGFIHPVLSYVDGEFSLEDSESVTLSNAKIADIVRGDLSRERFDSLIEYPSKIYRVNGNSIFGINEYKGQPIKTQEEEIHALLEHATKMGASDIHLAVNAYPMFRIQGTLQPISKASKLSAQMLKQIVSTLTVTDLQNEVLQRNKELEMAYPVSGLGRFRVQIVTQRGTYGIMIRPTSSKIPTVEGTKIPSAVVDSILNNPKGLVLVTGPTGSGKSTTCAALIGELKNQDSYSITTISDPIEFLHSHGKGIVTQREIPTDVLDFDRALSSSLRMDPDIIEVSEVRTAKALEVLLRFANSGHLAVSTMHTPSVKGSFDAIMNMLDSSRKQEILSVLSQSLVCVINQQLVKGIDGNLIPVFEYLIPNRGIRNYIAEGNFNMIEGEMKSSASMDKSFATWADYELIELFEKGMITAEVMNEYLVDKKAYDSYKVKL